VAANEPAHIRADPHCVAANRHDLQRARKLNTALVSAANSANTPMSVLALK
jgi:hypothetical protein